MIAQCECSFDCWESHFSKNRKECVLCAEYAGCIQHEIFDLFNLLEKQKKETDKNV